MTAMATMTPAPKPVAPGAHRAAVDPGVSMRRRKLRLATACYLGMVMLVALAIAMSTVLPAVLGVPLFIALAAAVVVIAHPTIRLTRRP